MSSNRLEIDQHNRLWQATASQAGDDQVENTASPAWVEKVERFVTKHPAALVISAVAVGLTLGWLGKRK
ncbi:hypothetical protein Pla144_24560 [Bythopirellula polymerisocia]|uniref:Uncharacterized protein n=1 Tax=Bythopirellula polymerisocia TaxID=2528003 RepID=A0A5C6CYF8_9BACT|nr:hypothetical protein Pla144_24560 [Bythopirellula polymerisocia]